MPTDESSLADTPVDVSAAPIVDTTEVVTPQDFDMTKFIAGVRATRRSVKLFPNAHMVARMEEIAQQIDEADDDADVDALIVEFEQCKAAFHDGVWFTIEKRSSEWEKAFKKRTLKKLGFTEKDLESDEDDEVNPAKIKVLLHQLAAQIVAPHGVTVTNLERMLVANEGELNKLIVCMSMANSALAESSPVLTRDFSQRRSGNRPRKGSSRR